LTKRDLQKFRAWAHSDEYPETGKIAYIDGEIEVDMSPEELAPTRQDTLSWPKWGQYYEASGKAGEAPDMPAAQELLQLSAAWRSAKTPAERKAAWEKMLAIHAEQQFIIGTVSGVMQPIVVLLPAPFGPRRPKNSPCSTVNETPRTASTGGVFRVPG